MCISKTVIFVFLIQSSFLKKLSCTRALHPLQILPSDSWRVKYLIHDIIPDVLPKSPNYQLQVNFQDESDVNFGNVLHPDVTRFEPVFINTTADFGLHILIMTDLDYPSPTSSDKGEYLHWMVININHCHVSDGDVLSSYVSPHRSGHEGGTHRYMFAYFRQQEETALDFLDFDISEDEIDHPERTRFCTKTFVTEHNLSLPIAANFFRIKWQDDSKKD